MEVEVQVSYLPLLVLEWVGTSLLRMIIAAPYLVSPDTLLGTELLLPGDGESPDSPLGPLYHPAKEMERYHNCQMRVDSQASNLVSPDGVGVGRGFLPACVDESPSCILGFLFHHPGRYLGVPYYSLINVED